MCYQPADVVLTGRTGRLHDFAQRRLQTDVTHALLAVSPTTALEARKPSGRGKSSIRTVALDTIFDDDPQIDTVIVLRPRCVTVAAVLEAARRIEQIQPAYALGSAARLSISELLRRSSIRHPLLALVDTWLRAESVDGAKLLTCSEFVARALEMAGVTSPHLDLVTPMDLLSHPGLEMVHRLAR